MRQIFIMISLILSLSCESTYTKYIVDPEIVVPKAIEDTEAPALSSKSSNEYKYITVKQNNGKSYTEVLIPIFSKGQKIIVDYEGDKNKLASLAPNEVAPPPFANDRIHLEMERAYKSKGFTVNTTATPVSLSKSRKLLEKYMKNNNYASALILTDKVLERYPSQVEFMRAKGSIYLLMGEKEASISTFEKAQAIDYSENVQYQIDNLLEN